MGVRTFVCLQESGERDYQGNPMVSYTDALRTAIRERGLTGVRLHFHPIRDNAAPSVAAMGAILRTLAAARERGLVYLHCWGGHGRTGTAAACWMMRQGLTLREALRAIKWARCTDPYLRGRPAPQTATQFDFLCAWWDEVGAAVRAVREFAHAV
jgi:hypothetical protein